jgi:3-hydroxymyristoyl/3-hydroxydecanoyl-(acyl carrier protein) dehydratase
LESPGSPFVCRNLEGRATILRDADPRGRTLRQHTTLIDHSALPDTILHRYAYEVALDGEPVYVGESVHGFFSPEVLSGQQGLDGGRCVPNWLARQAARPAGVRRLDVSGDTRLGRGRLALLHEVDLLPDGGSYGAGYARWERVVSDDDWFMAHHFFNDPVMPGSVGVEALFQGVGAWALHTGVADGLREPQLRPAAGVELSWKYRGQIQREHKRMCGEAHIREVRRSQDRIFVIADGSVYRNGLRIHQIDNIGVEVRPAGGERS